MTRPIEKIKIEGGLLNEMGGHLPPALLEKRNQHMVLTLHFVWNPDFGWLSYYLHERIQALTNNVHLRENVVQDSPTTSHGINKVQYLECMQIRTSHRVGSSLLFDEAEHGTSSLY